MKATSTSSDPVRVDPGAPPPGGWTLAGVDLTRTLESQLAAALPPHTLMQRAGLSVARLALALAPHARTFWVACGPGNNGGDGLEAAVHLHRWGKTVRVTWLGTSGQVPADAQVAWERAQAAGVQRVETPPDCDAAIDALLGIGASRPPGGVLAEHIAALNRVTGPVLAVDLPSGLDGSTGATPGIAVCATHTLALLSLKPGLYTAQGRDHAGEVWWDGLRRAGDPADAQGTPPSDSTAELARDAACLVAPPTVQPRPHASHKGSYGDVAVVGGAPGMAGAALLAARAALRMGAGRVYVGLLDREALRVDPGQVELMLRDHATLDLHAMTVVAGCGGGDAIRGVLPRLLAQAPRLVLDADALNAVAADPMLHTLLARRAARGAPTVLTPHPLEAARLLDTSAAEVQRDRLHAARDLAGRTGACVVLKGSGTVIAAPGELPRINPTGNARLASAGTGDVLAGMLAACWAQGLQASAAACAAVWLHGRQADLWAAPQALTASTLL